MTVVDTMAYRRLGNFTHLSVNIPALEGTETVQDVWIDAVEGSQYQEAIITAVPAGD